MPGFIPIFWASSFTPGFIPRFVVSIFFCFVARGFMAVSWSVSWLTFDSRSRTDFLFRRAAQGGSRFQARFQGRFQGMFQEPGFMPGFMRGFMGCEPMPPVSWAVSWGMKPPP